MNVSDLLFYVISGFLLISAFLAVTSKKIFRAAIWLLFSLVGIAGLYFWMEIEFVAAVQIIVYVGGIIVLIIFSIFLTNQSGHDLPRPPLRRSIFSIIAIVAGFPLAYLLIYQHSFPVLSKQPIDASPSNIGSEMLSTTKFGYVLPFEVLSVLLLAAMIGCIVIALKPKSAE